MARRAGPVSNDDSRWSQPSGETLGRFLGALQDGTRDYLSHVSALFVLGFSERLPKRLTIVSSGRRRPRTIGDRSLAFVFHPAERPHETVQKMVGKDRVLVSSLEQTLVDCVCDLHLLEDRKALAGWFADLPYRLPHLIDLAGRVGETPLRRVLFWAVLAGRAAWEDLPEHLSQAPVQVFPHGWAARGGMKQVWESRLRLLFPAEILAWACPPAFAANEAEDEWQELLRFRPLRSRLVREGRLLIRNDPRPESRGWLDRFFAGEATARLRKEPETLVLDLFCRRFNEPLSGRHPRLLLSWMLERLEVTPAWRESLLPGVRQLLAAKEPIRLEAALHQACRLGLIDKALAVLSKQRLFLYQSGCFRTIAFVCREALQAGKTLPANLRNLYARSLAATFQGGEALTVSLPARLRSPRSRAGLLERGDAAYTAAAIHLQNGSLDEAEQELAAARDWFSRADDPLRLGKVWTVAGNIDAARGLYSEARKWYAQAFSVFRDGGPPGFLGMLQNNLGFVEYRSGRYVQAERLLRQAQSDARQEGNPVIASRAMVTLGNLQAAIGDPAAAFLQLTEAHSLQTLHPGSGCPEETAALIAWSCELQGLHAAARPWWRKASAGDGRVIPASSAWTIGICGIRSELLNGRPVAAKKAIAVLSTVSGIGHLSSDDRGTLDYLRGMVELATGSGRGFEAFRHAERQFPPENTPMRGLLTLMQFLSLPSPGLLGPVREALASLAAGRFHDPLWTLYADRLMRIALPEARLFLRKCLQRTPVALLQGAFLRIPGLKRLARRAGGGREKPLLTLVRDGTIRACSPAERDEWLAGRHRRIFRFDGPTGVLELNGKTGTIRPGSHPHTILSQLLTVFPSSLSIKTLYRSAWGCEYDHDCDGSAVKAALSRLRAVLESVNPRGKLVQNIDDQGEKCITFEPGCRWECVL